MNRKSAPVPEPIAQLQRQLDQFRSTQPTRTKLPESLWQAAVGLARQHGVHAVARPLRLDYVRLKKRLGGSPMRWKDCAAISVVRSSRRPHPKRLAGNSSASMTKQRQR